LVVETGVEELTANGENIKSTNEQFTFSGGEFQSNQFARNGKSSLLLTSSNPFGLSFSIPVSKGKRYKAELWQRSLGQKQVLIIASATKSEVLYRTSDKKENQSGKWTSTQLNLSLPENYPEDSINFYLWNPENDSVWIDDFKLMVFE